jgi:hemerythrin-like domain-containing protein
MTTDLETRSGLPDALRVLVEGYPRDIWESHRNFDALTRFWLERHLMFREVLGRLTAETEAYLDNGRDAEAYGRQMARLAGFFLNQLHGHHQIEDAHYFPTLSALDARLTGGFELLDSDHHALDGHLRGLADDTNAMLRAISQGTGARDAAGVLRGRLRGFGGFLDRHLEDEEDLVIPTILHYAPRL